jgi:hypothetical protein
MSVRAAHRPSDPQHAPAQPPAHALPSEAGPLAGHLGEQAPAWSSPDALGALLRHAVARRASTSAPRVEPVLQRCGDKQTKESVPEPEHRDDTLPVKGEPTASGASLGRGELVIRVASDGELSKLPEVVADEVPPSDTPVTRKTGVRAIIYAPFTGHRDLGLEELPNDRQDGPAARLQLLESKLDAAVKDLNTRHDGDGPETLRVFLAPEWFFTNKTGDRPYTLGQLHEAIEGLERISQKHPDIVLAPGSIRWARLEPEPAPWPPQSGRRTLWEKLFGSAETPPPVETEALFNSAVVFYGGKMEFIYHKQHEGTDYGGNPAGRKQAFVNEVEGDWSFHDWQTGSSTVGMAKPGSEPKPIATANALRRAGAPSNLFTIEGVDFAIDICADFGRGTALRQYIDTHATGEGVDVHLVTAAGIAGQLNPQNTAARVGGYALLAEGGAMKSRPEGRSKIGKITAREGTLESGAKNEKVTMQEEVSKTYLEPDRKDLVIFDNILALPPRKDD